MLTLAILPRVAAGQTTDAPLSGRVVDEAGQALSGVSIQVVSTDRRAVQTAFTDADGRYAFKNLQVGQYSLTFSAINFAELRRRDVIVSTAATVRIDVTLHLALNAAVVVTARETFRNLADLDHPEENLVGVATRPARAPSRPSRSNPVPTCGPVRCSKPCRA